MHANNPELLKAQELGLKIYYPEFLYEQSKKNRVVSVALMEKQQSLQ
jgi:UDP-N-acetylmuramate: L-alanyl-gamma-D-glutamyl-meso-diaminopimelate ligase